ncbi:Zinc ABC transporter, substrate-binding protein ZnuA [Candidatus Syntrophocurvum alkaliphilum]|uniref:Zinc ABC transporter, substrate-binding protein ZnuA n=1 Tax=Candidatus Syntrophocurvum alkaliphilum TaxID=2293317 RepID=A0A6I6DB26_9FIRM|nr:zinc ABC transporter substrate-binding protein [Candidatus Syntrophocurvum alkaliphilum]QGT98704.1 Zinc ABC transporter, substrate-binding protein ZnuA [Candidatus Syntrophocurvum alkaliphilum]
MKTKKSILALLLIVVFLAAGCTAYSIPSGVVTDMLSNEDKELNVYVSVLPQKDFVEQIGGDKVNVSVLIPSGACPEHYEFTTEQLRKISNADLYISIGNIPVEEVWLERLQPANKDMVVVDSSESIETKQNDPHIWLSPRLVKIQAENIYRALTEIDPENKSYYQHNKKDFLKDLNHLDSFIEQTLADINNRMFVVYHPAWRYFASDYNLEEVGIEEHGKEPCAGDMCTIIDKAKLFNVNVIFDSPQHSSRSAQAVADEIGAELMILNPLPVNYIEDMKEATLTLRKGMTK